MNQSDKSNYIQYRIDKSSESLEAAILLIKNEKWNSAVNRLYYAAYYAVSALLIKHDLSTKTHSGAKSLFFQHFVKSERIANDLGKTYSDLFDWRQKGDYGDFLDFNREDVLSIFEPTAKLVEAVQRLAK